MKYGYLPFGRLRPFLLLLAAAATNPAQALVIFSVNTLLDQVDDNVLDNECHTAQNTCSLRAAVMQANRYTGDNSVQIFVPAGTFVLNPPSGSDGETVGDLDLYQTTGNNPTVAILGAGSDDTIIDPDHHGRAFQIGAGREVYLIKMTMRNGVNPGNGGDSGGAIYNDGFLTVAGCVLENNSALYGGAIYNAGRLNILESTLRFNHSSNFGGALATFSRATLRWSTLNGNTAVGNGGGIFYNNLATATDYLILVDSTLSGNTTPANGGGIYQFNGGTFLYSTTVVGNKANTGLSTYSGGGVFANAGNRFALVNSILARNSAGFDTNNDCVGAFEAYGRNVVGDPTSPVCSTTNAPLSVITPNTIGGLQNNGGPTQTHALLPGSQAINDALASLGCVDENGQATGRDQRGYPRVAGPRCDLGAVEYGSFTSEFIFANGFQ
ncbi:MAG: choice-of-anchor Q domain-containing protein [Tahibacter sp.]